MLTAVQYIDDLLKLSGENEVPQSLVQAHQLPNLEVRYGLQELRTHFTQLRQGRVAEPVPHVGSLPIQQRTVDAFRGLLQPRSRVEWFTVRVDERIHQAPGYYDTIPFGMCFSIVAARLHANLVEGSDLRPEPTNTDTLVCRRAYGGLQTEQIVVLKGEALIATARTGDVARMGRICYNCVAEKPAGYATVDECLRDVVLIGINCKVYNKQHADLVALADGLIRDAGRLFEAEFGRPFPFVSAGLLPVEQLEALIRQLNISAD